MYDRERIARVISDINRYLQDIPLLMINTPKDLEDRKNFYALSMLLFSLLNAVIDLAEETVVAEDLGAPVTYREIFSLLTRNGIIDQPLFDRMSALVSYRNRLAHEYGEITPEDMFRVLSMADEIRTFVHCMQERAGQERCL
jgi:uncharacterized protein YutE (UPF0331/DUF86 family)